MIKRQLYSGHFTLREAASFILACILHTATPNTDPNSFPPEVKPHPTKTIYNRTGKEFWSNSVKVQLSSYYAELCSMRPLEPKKSL